LMGDRASQGNLVARLSAGPRATVGSAASGPGRARRRARGRLPDGHTGGQAGKVDGVSAQRKGQGITCPGCGGRSWRVVYTRPARGGRITPAERVTGR